MNSMCSVSPFPENPPLQSPGAGCGIHSLTQIGDFRRGAGARKGPCWMLLFGEILGGGVQSLRHWGFSSSRGSQILVPFLPCQELNPCSPLPVYIFPALCFIGQHPSWEGLTVSRQRTAPWGLSPLPKPAPTRKLIASQLVDGNPL